MGAIGGLALIGAYAIALVFIAIIVIVPVYVTVGILFVVQKVRGRI